MYTQALLALSLAAMSGASPVPQAGPVPSTTIVDVPSSVSFSSLIIANPSSTSASQGVPGALGDADSFVTPSNVDVPRASATLSLNGDLPSLSLAPSQLGASETGSGVRVVGQTQEEAQGQSSVESGSVTGGESDAASESGGDESNSAGPVAGSIGMAGMAVAATLSIVAGLA